jgi:uncharacterized RDD family membrane protein YckC
VNIVCFVVLSALEVHTDGTPPGVVLLASLAVAAYVWVCNAAGVSLGKLVTATRVRRLEDNREPGPGWGLIRSLVSVGSLIPLGLGYFWVAWDDALQTWHDKVAGTVVVYKLER